MTRKKEPERQFISASTKRRPYGVKLSLLLESSTKLNIDGECSLLILPDYILKITPRKSNAALEMKGREVEAVVRKIFEEIIADFTTT